MEKPKIYVGRVAHGWDDGGHGWNYLSEQNQRKLGEFSTPLVDDAGPRTPGEEELVGKLAGARAILLPNGSSGDGITEGVLRQVGTVEAVVVAHSAWHGQCWDAAEKLGIKTVEGSNAIDMAVAEWTLAAAIMGRRNLIQAGRSLKEEGVWQKDWRKASMLLGSTVGLVGLGRIGRIAVRHFRALGTDVVAYDKYFDKAKAAELGVKLVGLDELLATADVVSLHLPVTPETTGLLGAREFALVKDGAVFVNSARAALYDADALAKELGKGRFQAFFDVYPEEGDKVKAHSFYKAVHKLDNVYMSSHIAGTNDAMYERAGAESIETLRRYFAGEGLRDARNLA